MRALNRIFVITGLLISGPAFAEKPVEETKSYRHLTLSADVLGLSLLVAGGLAEEDGGGDTTASTVLFGAGSLATFVVTPTIHWARADGKRAATSFLMRVGLAGAGMVTAISLNSGCGDGQPPPDGELFDDDFLCELDYVGYGFLGGLVLASALDAAFMTDERVARPATWAPQISATRDGVRAGVAWAW